MSKALLLIGLYAFAVMWPWSGYLSGNAAHFYNVLVLMLGILGLINVIRTRRLLTPWELIWPLLLIEALLPFLEDARHISLTPAIAILAIHAFRDHRSHIATAFALTSFSAAIAVIFSTYAQFANVFPTAYSIYTPTVLHFPRTLAEGGLILALASVVGIAAAASRLALLPRILATCAALICLLRLAWLAYETADLWPGYLALPDFSTWPLANMLFVVLVIYLALRVAAKALVAQKMDGAAAQSLYAAPPLVISLTLIAVPQENWATVFLLLGLCAAYVLPPRVQQETSKRASFLVALLVVTLLTPIVLSLVMHNITNTWRNNPLNYTQRADHLWEEGRTDEAYLLLYRVNELAPHERYSYMWIASYNLSFDHLDHAAMAFSRAIRPGPPPTVLSSVDEETRSAFKRRLRDAASTQEPGKRSLAYERVLIASGDEANAIALLQARPTATPPAHLSVAVLARALAWVVGAPELEETFRAWPREQLFGILRDAGAQAMPPSLGPPRGTLEILAPGYRFWEQVTLRITPLGAEGRHNMHAAEPLEKIYMYYAAGDDNTP